MNPLPDAYPLQWPEGWARTQPLDRKPSRYKIGPHHARIEMFEAVRKLGGDVPIVSSNLHLRQDGKPYANQAPPEDPGVAVYWVRHGKQEVMACDRWLHPWENMRAIYHAIEGLRAMERAGATQIMERAFQAFQLPETTREKKSWRVVLDIDDSFEPSVEYLRSVARRKMAQHHPDMGGDIEQFRAVEQALNEALREIRR